MKRLRRWLFNGVAGVSLLLCMTICVLWAWSYAGGGSSAGGQVLQWGQRAKAFHWVHSKNGQMRWVHTVAWPVEEVVSPKGTRVLADTLEPFRSVRFTQTMIEPPPDHRLWRHTGIWWLHASAPDDPLLTETFTSLQYLQIVIVPHWLPAFGFGIVGMPVAVSAWRWTRHRRRHQFGLCPICAYNLAGNTSGVCPECGTPVAKVAT